MLTTERHIARAAGTSAHYGPSLFELDILLADQYGARPRLPVQPERRLMLAILEDAVDVIRRYGRFRDPAAVKLTRDARDWMTSTERHWPFSFENICDAVGLDADAVRTRALDGAVEPRPVDRRHLARAKRLSAGSKCRAIRGACGWTRADLARRLGVQEATVKAYENGDCGASAAVVDDIDALYRAAVIVRHIPPPEEAGVGS